MTDQTEISTDEELEDEVKEAEEVKEPSVEDDIAAALKELEAAEEPEKQEQEPEAPKEAAEAEEATGETEGKTEGEDAPTVDAPNSWSAKDAEVFRTLPREAQEVIARREKERDSAFYQERQERQQLEPVLGPVRQAAERSGISLAQGLQNLAKVYFGLENPATRQSTLDWLAQQYGTPSNPERETDPVQSAIGDLQSQIQTLFQQNQQALEQNTRNGLEREVTAWWNEKNPDGSLVRPFAERVEADLMAIVPSLKATMPNASNAEVLQKAYETAVYSNPELRAEMFEAERKAKAVADREALARKEAQARRAGASVTGSPDSDSRSGPPANASLEQELEYFYDQAAGSAQ